MEKEYPSQELSLAEQIEKLKQENEALRQENEGLRGDLAKSKKESQGLREKSEKDFLTGLYNREYFTEKAVKFVERANFEPSEDRRQKKISMVFIDIDNFKFINDNYGHEAGDEVLKEVANVLKIHTRGDSDIAARLGGEELVAFMPGADEGNAKEKAEQFCDMIRLFKVVLPDGRLVPVTVSVGVAEFQKGDTLDNFVKRSDKAMYRAKSEGKDRVITSSEAEEVKSNKE